MPDFVRVHTQSRTEYQFKRYAAVLQDPKTPVVGLEVITNSDPAAQYFLSLMERFRIPGRVLVKP